MKLSSIVGVYALTNVAVAFPFWHKRESPKSYATKTMHLGTGASPTATLLELIGDILPPTTALVASPTGDKHKMIKKAASTIPVSPVPTDYANYVLYYHAVARQNHSVPYMTYNSTLATYAQSVASSCVYGHDLSAGGGGYGQNIAAVGSNDPSWPTRSPNNEVGYSIIEQWFNNEMNYFLPSYYGQPTPDLTNFDLYGHFTQVIWKGSTSVGCATQYCPAGTVFPVPFNSWYTVCNYYGAGNVIGQFGANVFPANGDPTVHASA